MLRKCHNLCVDDETMGRKIQTERGDEDDSVDIFVGVQRKHTNSPWTRESREHDLNCAFNVHESVGIIQGIAYRQFSVSCSASKLYDNIAQLSLFRNVHRGEDVQIKAMDIPRCFNLFRNRDREWVDVNAIFSGEGSNDLLRRA